MKNKSSVKYIKYFENDDYLTHLQDVSRSKNKFMSSRLSGYNNPPSGHLAKISAESEERNQYNKMVEEREHLIYQVSQALVFSDQNKGGFDDFKSKLQELLSLYPLENLPEVGFSIYRKDKKD